LDRPRSRLPAHHADAALQRRPSVNARWLIVERQRARQFKHTGWSMPSIGRPGPSIPPTDCVAATYCVSRSVMRGPHSSTSAAPGPLIVEHASPVSSDDPTVIARENRAEPGKADSASPRARHRNASTTIACHGGHTATPRSSVNQSDGPDGHTACKLQGTSGDCAAIRSK
jgi:hypothetical protein